ncbi:hypothetical protein FACS189487_07970 [Campylobacterota bacterium]|nr:hypothetical protein FACS189487_07970 [Campylobacterota bacterium]
MGEQSLILEAAKIMVVGMTTVFAFLTFMIFFLKVQARILTRFFPQKEPETQAAQTIGSAKLQGEQLNKVILAAIGEFRKKQHH